MKKINESGKEAKASGMGNVKTILGIVSGIAAGAVIGVLLAPDKGSNTRKRIVRKGTGYVDNLKGTYNNLVETITDNYDVIKDDIVEIASSKKNLK